jgi:hypothetical protein
MVLAEARVDWKKLNDELSTSIFDFKNRPKGYHELEVANEIIESLKSTGFVEVGRGRHRCALKSPTGLNVIKIPLSDAGLLDNEREARYWKEKIRPLHKKDQVRLSARLGKTVDKNAENEIQLARCRMMGVFLVMEFVNNDMPGVKVPDWADYIDCGQVGMNRKKKIVAYDYA